MSILERIFAQKQQEVAAAQAQLPFAELEKQAKSTEPPRGFRAALANANGLALIAEVKKASPSQGLIRPNFDAVDVATTYEQAGAHCLSVLTDVPNFQGSAENLRRARAATQLPCLRKDFLYDPYQVAEARAWNADAILLIVAMLQPTQLHELYAYSRELGMDTLVEVHTEAEAEIALKAGCDLIGVNNRDLADFKTDVAISERILPMLKGHALPVSESALASRADLDRVEAAGAKAVLIGTTFTRHPDIAAKVREVMGW